MKILIVIILLFLPVQGWGATYNWYFDDDAADDSGVGSQGDPWKTTTKLVTQLALCSSGDIVNASLDRTDTFPFDHDGVGLRGYIEPPLGVVLNLGAYGTGARPILDGQTSFASNPLDANKHITDAVINFRADSSSVENIEIINYFANGIRFGDGTDDHTIKKTKITYMGTGGIVSSNLVGEGTSGSLIEQCEVGYYWRLEELGYTEDMWAGGISLTKRDAANYSNTVRGSYVHHGYGEGIYCDFNSDSATIIEYNVLQDIRYPSLFPNPRMGYAGYYIARYNLIFSTGTATYGRGTGIYVCDEQLAGDNSNANINIYGNTIAGMYSGFWFSPLMADIGGVIRIYNNGIIDCPIPYRFGIYAKKYSDIRLYNNTSIKYDLTGTHFGGESVDYTGFTMDNNHFYGGTIPSVSPWTTNLKSADPKLPKSSGWRSLVAIPDFDTELYPPADSGLVKTGKDLEAGYDSLILTIGTDFSVLPGTVAMETYSQSVGSWGIGAAGHYSGTKPIPPSLLRIAVSY